MNKHNTCCGVLPIYQLLVRALGEAEPRRTMSTACASKPSHGVHNVMTQFRSELSLDLSFITQKEGRSDSSDKK